MTLPDIFASSATICKSFFVSVAAFSCLKATFVLPLIALAILVFPVPGGPYKIMDDNCLATTMRLMIFPGETRCS